MVARLSFHTYFAINFLSDWSKCQFCFYGLFSVIHITHPVYFHFYESLEYQKVIIVYPYMCIKFCLFSFIIQPQRIFIFYSFQWQFLGILLRCWNVVFLNNFLCLSNRHYSVNCCFWDHSVWFDYKQFMSNEKKWKLKGKFVTAYITFKHAMGNKFEMQIDEKLLFLFKILHDWYFFWKKKLKDIFARFKIRFCECLLGSSLRTKSSICRIVLKSTQNHAFKFLDFWWNLVYLDTFYKLPITYPQGDPLAYSRILRSNFTSIFNNFPAVKLIL